MAWLRKVECEVSASRQAAEAAPSMGDSADGFPSCPGLVSAIKRIGEFGGIEILYQLAREIIAVISGYVRVLTIFKQKARLVSQTTKQMKLPVEI